MASGWRDTQQVVGYRVRAHRSSRGWSQKELAAAAGLHPAYVGHVERGERNVTLGTLMRLAEAFQVPLSDLVQDL